VYKWYRAIITLGMHDSFGEDNFEILAECEDGYVGICKYCQEFNYSYKNILLTFQEQEMNNFFRMVDRLPEKRRM
ncbi:MAG: DUF6686 family protein, partial [Bacteroidota bacterium]